MQTNFYLQKNASRNGINFFESKLKQANSEQRTANSEQRTANSEQRTAKF
jgi:hypothetical protein